MKTKISNRFIYERVPGISFDPKDVKSRSRTKQSFKEDSDINNIVAKYQRTGVLGNPLGGSPRYPQFGDFSNVGDYQSSLNLIIEANENFMLLPAVLRKRFNNDPQELISFMDNPDNLKEAQELGLVPKPVFVPPVIEEDTISTGDSTAPVE